MMNYVRDFSQIRNEEIFWMNNNETESYEYKKITYVNCGAKNHMKMIIAVRDANFAVRLIPLWSSTGDEDSLYNEIAPSLSDNTPLLNDELSVPVRMRRKDYRPPPAITNLLKSNTRLLRFMVIRQGLWMRGLGPNQAVMAARNLRTLTTAARLRALHLR